MATFYLTLLALGGVVLVLQLILGLVGMDGEGVFDDGGADGADGLELFTVRALAAASAFFGLTGLSLMQFGLPGWLALPVAIVVGVAAAFGVAYVMRSLGPLEEDRSFRIESTLGLAATVSLGIPGARGGEGKIHLIAHERFQEFNAVTAEDEIPSGTAVTVVDVLSSDTVVVVRSLSLLEESDESR
jgi:hypothetical protein